MGLNISVYDLEGNEHPYWNFTRFGGDRDVPNYLDIQTEVDKHEYLYKTSNTDKMCRELSENHPDMDWRWEQLKDILDDPKWWVHLSV